MSKEETAIKVEITERTYNRAKEFFEKHKSELERMGINDISKLIEEALAYFIEGHKEPIIT
jgi:hypothetical protein